MKALRWVLLLCWAFPLAAWAQSAESEAGDVSEVDKDAMGPLRERVRPVSGHLFLKKGRFEASPGLTISVKDAFYTKYIPGLSLTYFPTETVGVGLRFGYSIPVVSGAAQICTNENNARGCRLPEFSELETKKAPGEIKLVGGLDAQWSPIYGKISLSGERFLHFDMYGLAGASLVQYGPSGAMTVGGNLGLGMRFVVNRYMAVRTEVRDLLYQESAPNSTSDSFRQQILVDFGFSLFFPTTFEEG